MVASILALRPKSTPLKALTSLHPPVYERTQASRASISASRQGETRNKRLHTAPHYIIGRTLTAVARSKSVARRGPSSSREAGCNRARYRWLSRTFAHFLEADNMAEEWGAPGTIGAVKFTVGVHLRHVFSSMSNHPTTRPAGWITNFSKGTKVWGHGRAFPSQGVSPSVIFGVEKQQNPNWSKLSFPREGPCVETLR